MRAANDSFLQQFVAEGYFTTLKDSWEKLIRTTETVFKPIVTDDTLSQTILTPLVYKAFMILREPQEAQRSYFWESFV